MIFCPKCGNQNNDGAAFCGQCGESLKKPVEAEATVPAAAVEAPAQTAPVNATAPMPEAAPAAEGMGAAPAAAPAPAPAAVPAGAPVAAKATNKMPIIIGAAVVIVAAILLIVLLVIPRCTSGVAASGIDMKTLVNGSTSDAQTQLDKMKKAEIDAGSGVSFNLYTSSDKMTDYVQGLFDSAMNGDIEGWDDILDSSKAKDLNGEWVLLSTADKDMEQYVNLVNSQLDGYDLGHMAAYMTIVSDDDLTNEEVAKLVSSAGLQYEHATVCDYSMDAVLDFALEYAKMAMTNSGYGRSNTKYMDSTLEQIKDIMDQVGIKRVGSGAYLGKDVYAVSVSAQFDGYAVVMLFAFNPSDFGMGDLLGDDFVNRMYVK